jgi:hypothetical protein
LLEEHEHHAVDPRRRQGALVAHHLATCVCAGTCNWNHNDLSTQTIHVGCSDSRILQNMQFQLRSKLMSPWCYK